MFNMNENSEANQSDGLKSLRNGIIYLLETIRVRSRGRRKRLRRQRRWWSSGRRGRCRRLLEREHHGSLMHSLLVLLHHRIKVNDVVFSSGDDLDARLAVLIGRVDDFIIRIGVRDPAILSLVVPLPNAVVLLELLVYLGFALGRQGGLLDEVD